MNQVSKVLPFEYFFCLFKEHSCSQKRGNIQSKVEYDFKLMRLNHQALHESSQVKTSDANKKQLIAY